MPGKQHNDRINTICNSAEAWAIELMHEACKSHNRTPQSFSENYIFSLGLLKSGLSQVLEIVSKVEEKLSQIEACGIKYAGVWQRASEYTRGQVVTESGSAWICVTDKTRAKPGAGEAWQLMVKAGSNAK